MANRAKIGTQSLTLLFGALALQICVKSLWSSVMSALWGVVVLSFLLCWVLLLEFYRRLVPGVEYQLKESLPIFIGNLAIDLLGGFQYWRLSQKTKRCQEVQDEYLMQLLEKRKNTEYGIEYGFSKIKSRKEFCQNVPINKYSDMKKYMERILDGENNILFAKRAKNINYSSGTSGEGVKYYAKTGEVKGFILKCIPISLYLTHRAYPETGSITKRFRVPGIIRMQDSGYTTKGGYTIGVVSENYSKSKGRQLAEASYTTPAFVQGITDEYSLAYVYLLLALRDRNVTSISGNVSVVVYITLNYMEKDWPSLVCDIRTGSLKEGLDVPKEIRKQLEAMMKPDAERADELELEFKKGFVGICKRVWPKMRMIETITSGSLGYFAKMFIDGPCKGIPIYSTVFGSTESFSAVNFWPEKPASYLPIIDDTFVEFIPEEHRLDEVPPTFTMEETQIGKRYEILVTNADGMYRFRIGDIFRVIDKYNNAPVLEYMYRVGDYLDIYSERMSSSWVDLSIEDTMKSFRNIEFVCATYAVSVKVDEVKKAIGVPVTGRGLAYTVFIELVRKDTGTCINQEDKGKFAQMVDDTLQKHDYYYSKTRSEGKYDTLEVCCLQPGSFVKFVSHLQDQGASSAQVKIPKVLKRPVDIQFLLEQLYA